MISQANPVKAREVYVTSVYERNFDATEQTIANIGGARSTKSHSICQLLIQRATEAPGRKICVVRKTGPALRRTARRMLIGLLKDYNLYSESSDHKSVNEYDMYGGTFDFTALDDSEKVRSTEYNDIWVEEADEISWDDYLVLLTRLSAKPKMFRNQVFLSFNPCDENSWIREKLALSKDAKFIHSTYRDNPFLAEDYIKTLTGLKEIDPVSFKIFAEGEWGKLTGLIYNFKYVAKLPDSYDFAIRGLDFGFNNPSSLVKVVVKDGKPFAHEELYKTNLTTPMLIAEMKEIIPASERQVPIYADSSEPDRIAEIEKAGFNVFPADKEVVPGILAVKAAGFTVTTESAFLLKEAKSYKWMKDRNGKVLDQPVKFNDHAMDALRYAWHSHMKGLGKKPTMHVEIF